MVTSGEVVLGILVATACGAGIGFALSRFLNARKERSQLPTSRPRDEAPSPAEPSAMSSGGVDYTPRSGAHPPPGHVPAEVPAL